MRMWPVHIGVFVSLAVWLSACAGVPDKPIRPDGQPEPRPVESWLADGARVMWVAPHPDDELFSGSLLARASIHYGNPLYFLVLTRGEGGECGLSRGCAPDLGTVRSGEIEKAAALYRAKLQLEGFFNAPLPVESFPKRHELFERWKGEGDPIGIITSAIKEFKPDLVLTFAPDWGATGHPEHQLTARLVVEALRKAAEGEGAHKIGRLYFMMNRHPLLRLLGKADPGLVTEGWDATQPCGEITCLEFMIRATRMHRTQHRDMQTVAEHRSAFETLYMRQVDPYTERFDPAEPAE